jgi:hypothetical protein
MSLVCAQKAFGACVLPDLPIPLNEKGRHICQGTCAQHLHGICGDPVDGYETRRICSVCAKEAIETVDATPADATAEARRALFAQAQVDQSKRHEEQEPPVDGAIDWDAGAGEIEEQMVQADSMAEMQLRAKAAVLEAASTRRTPQAVAQAALGAMEAEPAGGELASGSDGSGGDGSGDDSPEDNGLSGESSGNDGLGDDGLSGDGSVGADLGCDGEIGSRRAIDSNGDDDSNATENEIEVEETTTSQRGCLWDEGLLRGCLGVT